MEALQRGDFVGAGLRDEGGAQVERAPARVDGRGGTLRRGMGRVRARVQCRKAACRRARPA